MVFPTWSRARFHSENLGAGGRARETHLLMILLPDGPQGSRMFFCSNSATKSCQIYTLLYICVYNHVYIYIHIWLFFVYNTYIYIIIYMYMIDCDCLWCIYHYRSLSRRETINTIWGSSSLTCGVLPQASGLRNFIAATFACAGLGQKWGTLTALTQKNGGAHIYIYI